MAAPASLSPTPASTITPADAASEDSAHTLSDTVEDDAAAPSQPALESHRPNNRRLRKRPRAHRAPPDTLTPSQLMHSATTAASQVHGQGEVGGSRARPVVGNNRLLSAALTGAGTPRTQQAGPSAPRPTPPSTSAAPVEKPQADLTPLPPAPLLHYGDLAKRYKSGTASNPARAGAPAQSPEKLQAWFATTKFDANPFPDNADGPTTVNVLRAMHKAGVLRDPSRS